jgi:hypothetical protein
MAIRQRCHLAHDHRLKPAVLKNAKRPISNSRPESGRSEPGVVGAPDSIPRTPSEQGKRLAFGYLARNRSIAVT